MQTIEQYKNRLIEGSSEKVF